MEFSTQNICQVMILNDCSIPSALVIPEISSVYEFKAFSVEVNMHRLLAVDINGRNSRISSALVIYLQA